MHSLRSVYGNEMKWSVLMGLNLYHNDTVVFYWVTICIVMICKHSYWSKYMDNSCSEHVSNGYLNGIKSGAISRFL